MRTPAQQRAIYSKFLQLTLVCTTVLLSARVEAASKKGGKAAKKTEEAVEKPEDANAKPMGAGARLGYGMGIGATATGASFDLKLAPNRDLEIYGMYAKADLSKSITPVDGVDSQININGYLIMANLRYFFGKTFYAAPSLGWRYYNANFSVRDAKDSNNSATIDLKVSGIVAGGAIGNLWRFKNGLYVGGEWIAAQWTILGSAKQSTTTSGILTQGQDALQKTAADTGSGLLHTMSATLSTLLVGYSF